MQIDTSTAKLVLSHEDQISRAAILFILRQVKHDHSFRSSDDLVPVLCTAFNDPTANGITLGASKVSYSITYGIGPY